MNINHKDQCLTLLFTANCTLGKTTYKVIELNVDKTAFEEGEYVSREKSACAKGCKHPHVRVCQTTEHVSVALCARFMLCK